MKRLPIIDILYEDEYLLAVNKPGGLHSVAQMSGTNSSLSSALISRYPELTAAGKDPLEAGLVQRLDFETSGVMLVARNKTVWKELHTELLAGNIRKSYLAALEGRMEGQQDVQSYLGGRYRRSKKVTVYPFDLDKRPERSLEANTSFFPLHHLAEYNLTVVKARAPSARRHQIRAHAAYCGHPLLGDRLYGSTGSLQEVLSAPGIPGFFLHADSMQLIHPCTKKALSLVAPVPGYAAPLCGEQGPRSGEI